MGAVPPSRPTSDRPSRLVALGASNLTRGLPELLRAAGSGSPAPTEFLCALGLGRSYGLRSRVLFRSLPSILECGLWSRLSELPPASTTALVTDVGNDILYGASVGSLSSWVEECVARLLPAAWSRLLGGATAAAGGGAAFGIVETRLAPPERRWLFGLERRATQPAIVTPRGDSLSLF
jgi:hypothetical protein